MKAFRLSILLSICSITASSTTFSTVANGSWTAPATWLNGQVPPFHFADTVLVNNDLMYNTAIHPYGTAYLWVDSNASLCGHRKFFVDGNAVFENYGQMNADSLFVMNGGFLHNYGHILLTQSATIGNGGTLVNSGWMTIGASFLCSEKPNDVEEQDQTGELFFPNPVNAGGKITLISPGENALFIRLFSVNGELMATLEIKTGECLLPDKIKPGIYLAEISDGNECIGKTKLVVE